MNFGPDGHDDSGDPYWVVGLYRDAQHAAADVHHLGGRQDHPPNGPGETPDDGDERCPYGCRVRAPGSRAFGPPEQSTSRGLFQQIRPSW